MKTFLPLALALVVHGFAPPAAPVLRKVVTLNAMSKSIPFIPKPKNLDGMVGNEEFDPFGFCEYFEPKYMREAELKHGRVAMLAIVGYILPEFGVRGIFAPPEMYHPNPLKAATMAPPSAWATLIFSAGVIEWVTNKGKVTYNDMFEDNRDAGDLGFDPLGLMKPDDEESMKLKELTHCRTAMIAIGGMIHGSFVTGTGVFGSTA